MFKSAEERAAERREREAEEAREQAAEAERARAAEERRQREAFLATPVGAATAAKEAGQAFSRSSSTWALTSAAPGGALRRGVTPPRVPRSR
jgi:hypothetical protein